jgi:hypothetical protein
MATWPSDHKRNQALRHCTNTLNQNTRQQNHQINQLFGALQKPYALKQAALKKVNQTKKIENAAWRNLAASLEQGDHGGVLCKSFTRQYEQLSQASSADTFLPLMGCPRSCSSYAGSTLTRKTVLRLQHQGCSWAMVLPSPVASFAGSCQVGSRMQIRECKAVDSE